MSEDKTAPQAATWPLPKFHFLVDLGDGMAVRFQEVTGLDTQTDVIEFRHGTSPAFAPIKMPGIAKHGNVTLKKGLFANDDGFWTWYNAIKTGRIARREIVVSLLDEKGEPVTRWTLAKAWPVKVGGTDLRSDGNEVAIESIEIAHEGLKISQ